MKHEHIKKIEVRLARVLGLLLPDEVHRGSVSNPPERLIEIVKHLDGTPMVSDTLSVREATRDVVRLLEIDVPELIEALREAQGNQRRYCRYCGEYRIGLLAASHDDKTWECRDEDGCETRRNRKEK